MAERSRRVAGVVSCEHGGNGFPAEYARLFAGRARLLASHRGFDRGALALARSLSRTLAAPLHAGRMTRLLADLNRSPDHPRVIAPFVRDALAQAERARLLEQWHRPHRDAVRAAVARRIQRGATVVHVAAHSFTPVLQARGKRQVRAMDVALLYDPARPLERELCATWRARLLTHEPSLRVRFNAPYRGTSDGLTTWLRTLFPERRYAGIEVEVNQALVVRGRPERFARICRAIAAALQEALADLHTPRAARR